MSPYAFSCVLLCVAAPVMAAIQDDLDEVVVTASLTGSTLDKLAASATVLPSSDLDSAGVAHLGDVLGLVPNLSAAGGTSRPRYYQLRGIGETEQYEGAPNPSVGFLIDDVDFSGIGMPASLYDLQQAEVLRGPQGTAYGANALAGVISLRSQAPQQGFDMGGELEAGDYNMRAGGLFINNSLGSDTAWRLAAHRYTSDGFRRDAYLDRSDTNGYDEDLLRLRVTSTLGKDVKLDVTAMYSNIDNGYDAWTLDNSRVTLSDKPGMDAQRSLALAVRLDADLNDAVSLRSVTTLADADIGFSYDGDWANEEYWGVNGPYDFTEQIDRQRRNISQDLRFASRNREAGGWVAGIYALHMDEDYSLLDLYNGDVYRSIQSRYQALSLAAYGQVDRDLMPALTLSVGLRVERRDASYRDSNDLVQDPVDTMVGGHISLTRALGDLQSAYVALTRGYKAGGINTGALVPDALRGFDPESLWNLEAGWRVHSADRRFSAMTSVFYMRRFDQQVAGSVQYDPQDPLTFILLTDNASRGENYGLESQVDWQATQTLRVGATLGLLRARFLDYTLGDATLDGRDQPYAPHYQAGLTLDWRSSKGFFARADLQAVDGYFFSASHDQRNTAYQLLNLRIGYETTHWTASLWMRNALDENYATHGFYFNLEPPDYPAKLYLQAGDPRQVGMRVSFKL
ncbi:MAG: TonB-dependent receptor plug domain-containing protein [Pseudomonadota bacterium]